MSSITQIGIGICFTGIAAVAFGTNPLSLSFVGLIVGGQALARVTDLGKYFCRRFRS